MNTASRSILGRFLRRLPWWVGLIAILLAAPQRATAAARPATPAFFVHDQAGVLTPQSRERLLQALAAFQRETSGQIVVAFHRRQPPNEELDDYVNRLFNAFRIGRAGRDNSVLLLVFVEDRRLTSQVGRVLKRAIPDAVAERIIDERITPRFRAGDYEGGIKDGAAAFIAATKGEYRSPSPPTAATAATVTSAAVTTAAALPPKPALYVDDQAGVLSPQSRERLLRSITAFERETSGQIVVALHRRLPPNEELNDFANRLFKEWGIGQAEHDNGVLLLVLVDDRQLRIEVGYGLEGAIPDAVAKRIIEERITPRFRAGDYDGGIEAGVAALIAAAQGEYLGTGSRPVLLEDWANILIFLAIFGAIFGMAMKARSGEALSGGIIGGVGVPLTALAIGFFGIVALFSIPLAAWLYLRRTSSGTEYRLGQLRRHTDWSGSDSGGWSSGGWSSGGSSGGFSSGGGSSGGGGASGSW